MDSEIEIIETSKGKPLLINGGYRYQIKEIYKNGNVSWRCSNRNCGGRVSTTNDKKQILGKKDHTCVLDIAKREVEKCVFQCKKRAREEFTPIPQIVSSEFKDIKNLGLEFVTKIPELNSVKSNLYRARQKTFGNVSLPKHRSEIVLPPQLAENFLVIEDGVEDKILIFSNVCESLLNESEVFFGDGTFKSCFLLFFQLYTIHADVKSTEDSTSIIPVIFALLPNKEEKTYIRLFSLLVSKFKNFSPKVFKLDFEVATINAIRYVFPKTVIHGCNFHFNQAIWRKVQDLGLVLSYRNQSEVRNHIRMCAALAHLPEENIDEGWLIIMETSPMNDLVIKFNDYFTSQWLDNPIIQNIWICSGHRHRTTNAVEGWHSKLNKKIGKSHPNIFELITVLKEEAALNIIKLQKINLYIPTPKRLKKYVDIDIRIKKTLNDLRDKNIDLKNALNKFMYITKFE